jgi:hypothetical protein
MSTAYVMSRNVIIKALLPHRDTISTMIVSPRLSRQNFTFARQKKACRTSQKRAKLPLFTALCIEQARAAAGRIAAALHSAKLQEVVHADLLGSSRS